MGDITRQDVTAIVNAANSTLLGGGGVDGAIHRAGGPEILEECQEIRKTIYPDGLPTGEAVITTGGNLPAKYVIHTVGPIYGQRPEREAELLAACYQNSLLLARQHQSLRSHFHPFRRALMAIQSPKRRKLRLRAIKNFLTADEQIEEVRLVFFQQSDARVFLEYQEFE